MKKSKIIAGAAALSMMFAASPFASAAMWEDGLYYNSDGMFYNVYNGVPENEYMYGQTAQNKSNAQVMFNGEYIDFSESFPINDNGRIKLPFRELLENIGAVVDYDEGQNKVSAVRNNIKIEFSLGSDVISVNDGGNISEFKMDTSIDVINGRTFVPVRFIAEAFGLSVGWDDYFDTVVITDIDSYVNTLMTSCSNYMKLGDLSYGINNYTSNQKLNVSLDITNAFSETPSVSNIKFDLESKTDSDKNIISSYNVLNMSSFNIFEDNQPMDLKDLKFSFILSGNKLYIATNLVEEMYKLHPDDVTLAAAAGFIRSDTWLEGDIDELLVDFAGMDKESAELIVTMLSRPESFSSAMSAAFASFDENSSIGAAAARMQVETMSKLFGNDLFKLYENPDGSYSFNYKLDTGAFSNYIAELMSQFEEAGSAESLIEELGINFSMVMDGSISAEQMISNADMTISVDNELVKFALNMSVKSDTDIGVVDFTDYTLPQRTTSLGTILTILKD